MNMRCSTLLPFLCSLCFSVACEEGGGLGSGAGGTSNGLATGQSTGGTTSAAGGGTPSGSGGAASGNTATGATGGTAAGGTSGGSGGTGGLGQTGGSGGSDGSRSALADAWPCDGSTDGYDAVVSGSGSEWDMNGSSHSSMFDAMAAALGGGGDGENDKRTVLVQGSGEISGSAQLRIRSNTVLNVCGTIQVTDDVSGSDRSPAYARGASHIDIPHFNLTGHAQYGMFFRDVSDLHLGDISIDGTGGLGIRIDSHGSNDRDNATNITIDYVHVENTGGHGVEFYGVDGIEIGTVYARSTGNAGLLLNDSINANIDLVDAVDAAHIGTGYAAFRNANTNGRYDDGSYPINIRLAELRASGEDAGRGFFCVSGSGGVEIEKFVIDGVGGDPAIFIENCYNVTMASSSGSGTLVGGRAYIGHNSGNGDAARDVTFQNITLEDGAYIEESGSTCGNDNVAIDISGGSVDMCE